MLLSAVLRHSLFISVRHRCCVIWTRFGWYSLRVRLEEPRTVEAPLVAPVPPVSEASSVSVAVFFYVASVSVTLVSNIGG
jgi:hypothetical protein